MMKMRHFWPKSKAITLVFCPKVTKIDIKVMKMRHFWPKSKAITLVFCPKMTKIDID